MGTFVNYYPNVWGGPSYYSRYAFVYPSGLPECTVSGSSCVNVACPSPDVPVSYLASPLGGTAITVPTGGVEIPIGSTTIPAGTVTVVTGFTGTPEVNIGSVAYNTSTSQFTVYYPAVYLLTSSFTFPVTAATNIPFRVRLYIYKIDAATGVISLVGSTSTQTNDTSPATITVATQAQLNRNDRVFFAVTQNSGLTMNVITTSEFRVGITKLVRL